jgi:hypothetical protein
VCLSEYSVRVPLGDSFISHSLSSREKVGPSSFVVSPLGSRNNKSVALRFLCLSVRSWITSNIPCLQATWRVPVCLVVFHFLTVMKNRLL